MMHERKGQAAMEFLMTYGWAILAAIIAIGVLGYFGVFSPGKYITGSAILNPPFYADAWNVQSDVDDVTPGTQSGVILEFKNNGGEDYDVNSVFVAGCGTNDTSTFLKSGTSAAFIVLCSSELAEGSTFKGDITVNYAKSGSDVDLTSTGTVAEKITA
ncbi:hypothetical protein KW787_01915 [Candidatus Pacearchaeota archaeon]|nr:hypothetical protein [Candidatus Pacearchaeota archaeon]